jgi:hypothetical protein
VPGRHPAHTGAQTKQRAECIEVKYLADRFRADLVEPRTVADNARTVHKMRERSEGIDGRIKHALDIVLLRHVPLDRDCLPARPLYSVDDSGSSI